MTNKKILLVLGAGSSFPYGLPTSAQLRELILGTQSGDKVLLETLSISVERVVQFLGTLFESQLDSALAIRKWYVKAPVKQPICQSILDLILLSPPFNYHENEIKEFRDTFRESDRVSIDSFINQWEREFGEIAKTAVATFILLCERESRLGGDWYQNLNEALLRRVDSLTTGDLRIVTFNYDRSLQRYLNHTFRVHFRKDNDAAIEALRKIETHHVYGRLGDLDPSRADHVDYGRGSVKKAAEGIHLATDRTGADTKLINAWLEEADRIIFLGFGFWEENVRLLPLEPIKELRKKNNQKKQERFSSAFRLPKWIVADMQSQHAVTFGESDHNALDYVTNTAVFSWKVELPVAPRRPHPTRSRGSNFLLDDLTQS